LRLDPGMNVEYCLHMMIKPKATRTKIAILSIVSALTLGIHYGWLVQPLFGHVHWLHAVHGRFCYIPIVIAAAWFGLRGGLITATSISILLIPYIFGLSGAARDLATEMGEITFYFAIAVLAGVLVEREFAARKKQQETQLQVERSQKLSMVGQLAAGVAHEIKNPLASIKGAADILTDDDIEREEREEFKGILRNEIKRIDATVSEFLEFARPREAKMENFDLSSALQATVRQMQAHAKRKGVSIEAAVEKEVAITGDSEKLHQMTLNLLLNAIDASSKGGSICVQLLCASTAWVQLTIADSGRGIKESDLSQIFEPFFTTKSSGTGLGLAIVKEIVDSHQGEITITSSEGAGTRVEVRLPRSRRNG
jgi:two-component system sensor histidine kinase HydH